VQRVFVVITSLALVLASCGEERSGKFSGGDGAGDGGGGGPATTSCHDIDVVEVFQFEIFRYEASRPGGLGCSPGARHACVCFGDDGDDDGIKTCPPNGTAWGECKCPDRDGEVDGMELPACSKGGVMPWADVTRDQAEAACRLSGFELCSEEEWLLACQGMERKPFPYGRSYQNGKCNDPHSGANEVVVTGQYQGCISGYDAYDMVGNVWEWVRELGQDGEWRYAGYSHEVRAIAPTADPVCQRVLQTGSGQSTYDLPDVGFRCCREL
jgi:hypothetical protein